MKDFSNFLENNISDELLAAYIDGKTTKEESELIENSINEDSILSEIHDIANGSISFGNNLDWELHKGDFGFWELGLPPAVTEEDLLEAYNNIEKDMAKKTYGYEPNNELDTFDPNIWQGNQPTCAIRSQEIILRDYGIYHTQDELIEYAIKNGWFDPDPENGGTDKYAVGNILDACGIPTTRTDNATIYDIISELKAGHRVIVSVDADELWVKKEPNLFKRMIAQVNNKANDTIQNFLGLEGANHALVVAGVNVNPKDPSDIKVTLIDSGTGDVCIEYDFKEFHNAWSDGHCRMISTNIPAPFQYNYHTHQIEPSNIATKYIPAMATMPEGLTNQFHLANNYFEDYKDFNPLYDNLSEYIVAEGIDLPEAEYSSSTDIDNSETDDSVRANYDIDSEDVQQTEDARGNDIHEMDALQDLSDDDDGEIPEYGYGVGFCESEEESEEM